LVTRAPAKVNLDLRMRGVRADGYHLVSTVLHSIALADTLTLWPEPGPFAMSCDTTGVPTDARNLAWQGADAMAHALGITLDGWRLHLEKQVPAEAGLGGGSSDAAAAARLVARAAGSEPSTERLADIIRPLGADVAYFASGGAMRGEGVGDELAPLPDVPDATVLVVRPPFGVSTRQAYGWYDEAHSGRSSSDGPRPSEGRGVDPGTGYRVPGTGYDGWRPGGHWLAWADCVNDLEAPVAERHPEIRAIVSRLRRAGAWLAAMSGSGSACFGVFDPAADVAAVATGWPEGTGVWHTRLLSRAAYAEMTRCLPGRTSG
jgi:4-diphosphocytidyl-2-C-methyl-D-erythritol kinase